MDYHRYMASREWALKRQEVRARSGGKCDRCKIRDMASVHHTTYERLGNELPTDLLAVCKPCHEWLSGRSDIDPAEAEIEVRRLHAIAARAASEDEAIAAAQAIVTLRRRVYAVERGRQPQ